MPPKRAPRLRIRRVNILLAASVLSLAAPAPQARAEAAPDEQPTRPPAIDRYAHAIEEIVVTARKREENSQQVPVAITAIGEDEIERYNLSDLSKLAQMTPQLFVAPVAIGNGGALTIRGIGSSFFNAGAEQAVSIYVDGLQFDRGHVLTQGYLDLARVEVMKGPQALFFGKNNTAGVISLTSADPGPEREVM